MKEGIDKMNLKKVTAMMMCVVMMAMLAAGCAKREKPDAGIKTYAEAILHQDSKSLEKLGVDPNEAFRTYMTNFMGAYNQYTGGLFSAGQMKIIGSAVLLLFNKASINTAVVSENGNNAVVKVTVGKFDVAMMNDRDIVAEVYKINPRADYITDPTAAAGLIATAMANVISAMQPNGTSSFNIDCVYNDKANRWEPADMDTFSNKLMSAVLGL